MLWLILVLFQVKHFLCDYPLQTAGMLGKGSNRLDVWFPALAQHSAVHALGTFVIVAPLGGLPLALPLAGLDYGLHFAVDRLKAAPTLGGRWKPNQPAFWWALGADQMAHHLVNVWFAWIVVGG